MEAGETQGVRNSWAVTRSSRGVQVVSSEVC